MKIFIIDDDQFSLFFTRYKLLTDKLTEDIHTFLSAEEGLKSLSQCNDDSIPDVILLDLNMPVMDGWQFLEALESSWPRYKNRCRVFILTSSLDSSDQKRANLNPMVAGFFDKPLHSEDILQIHSEKGGSIIK